MRFYWLVIGSVAVWRITYLLQAEDGPWDVVVRLRRSLGSNEPPTPLSTPVPRCIPKTRRNRMSCCGQKRMAAATAASPVPAARGTETRRTALAYFQYTGATAMTVTGGATAVRYRFAYPGAILAVDPRDRPSIARVPHLRQTAGP